MNLAHTLVAGMALTALIGLAATADAKGPPADKGGKNARARSRMVRPADASDANAKGRIDIATMKNGRSSLRVMGQDLTPGTNVTFRIRGDEEFGAGTVNDEGGVHVFLRTKKGDDLPLDEGENTVGDLANDLVEILAGETVLLAGTVPSLVDVDLPRRFHGRASLEAFGNSTTRGRVRLVFRRRDNRSRVVVGAAGFAEGETVTFYMGADAENLEEAGSTVANAEGGARYVVRTDHGDPLPLLDPETNPTALDLRGYAVEVRVGDVVHLTGNMPGELPSSE